MRRICIVRTCIALSLTVAVLSAQDEKKPKTVSKTFSPPGVTCQVPSAWQGKKTSSTMRAATWTLSHKSKTADIVVYWFGKRGAGDVESNLDRWRRQIKTATPPEPREIEIRKGYVAHLLDAKGTYVAPVRPGSKERNNTPDSRLLAAVIETPGGPLYVKSVGPASVLDAHEGAFMAWVKSFDTAKAR